MTLLLLIPLQLLVYSLIPVPQPYTSKVHYDSFPHIVEYIVTQADYQTKLQCRATCRALRKYTDTLLLPRAVTVDNVLAGSRSTGLLFGTLASPFDGTEYPFFKQEGDLPAQRCKLRSFQAQLIIRNVEARTLTPLLGRLQRVLIDQHFRGPNYQLLEFDAPSFLAMEVDRQCSCGKRDLDPPFHHDALNVNVSLKGDEGSQSQDGDSPAETEILPGSASQCHLLQHVLHGRIRQLQLFIHLFITEASIEHLPAYMFPWADQVNMNPALVCYIKIPTRSPNPLQFLPRVRAAFAKHLRVNSNRIFVEQSQS